MNYPYNKADLLAEFAELYQHVVELDRDDSNTLFFSGDELDGMDIFIQHFVCSPQAAYKHNSKDLEMKKLKEKIPSDVIISNHVSWCEGT